MKATWYGALHWSYNTIAWFGAFGSLQTGQFLLRHELTFYRDVPELAAAQVVALKQRKKLEPWAGCYAQPKLFPKPGERGEFPNETFGRHGLHLTSGGANQVIALQRLRSWLEPMPQAHGKTEPALLVHPDCEYFIKCVPAIEAIEDLSEDAVIAPELQPALAAGYFVMSRPMRLPEADPVYPDGAIGWDVEALREEARRRV